MLKSLLKGLAPRYTTRRILAELMVTLLTQPLRFRHRLNRENVFLYRQFATVSAHCCVCGFTGSLYFGMPDRKLRKDHGIGVLRETLLCKSCGSTNRQRTVANMLLECVHNGSGPRMATLKELCSAGVDAQMWDTDAFSPLSKMLLPTGKCVLSKYIPARDFGVELEPRIFNIDLQTISFESDRFDVIISSDIMEHVRDDLAAHKEIFRCLKPGGTYVFTVPYDEDHLRNRVLVDSTSGKDVFLEQPHYHGDPLSGGILAYRIYGRELVSTLQSIGFQVEYRLLNDVSEGIFSGDCFLAKKPGNFKGNLQ